MGTSELWVPMDESTGSCFHATKCGAHSLERIPVEQFLNEELYVELSPCGNCQEYHGLDALIEQHEIPTHWRPI